MPRINTIYKHTDTVTLGCKAKLRFLQLQKTFLSLRVNPIYQWLQLKAMNCYRVMFFRQAAHLKSLILL